ncbi:methyl-accepting chemotaxis protein [Paenibacillus athensensis]|uniref:Methyl-accepting chemotaxis protein n=1 Tax=Paenibacillus athensensis TaxID=1967502 RepID=A0A4Y8Q9H1_9BACL|nr:methyl-accepting chemotaxis protein [Paenibacillus athensensis]MCD1259030.1 methyl-accepting chemotaxis protein [Paenibacillus athensensis]
MGFKHLRVSFKLVILVFVLLALMGTVGIVASRYLDIMHNSVTEMYDNRVQPVKWLNEARALSWQAQANLYAATLTQDAAGQKKLEADVNQAKAKFAEAIASYGATELDPYEVERLDKLRAMDAAYQDEISQIMDAAKAGNIAKSQQLMLAHTDKVNQLNGLLTELSDYNAKVGDDLKLAVDRDNTNAHEFIIAMLIAALLLGSLIGYWINRLVTKPLKEIQQAMSRAEQGDLTVSGSYRSRDELGRLTLSFNTMIAGLRDVLAQVQGTAQQVAASSEELTQNAEETGRGSEHISVTIQELATGSENQVRAVMESSEAIQLVSGTVTSIADSAQTAARHAASTAQRAESGGQGVARAIRQMDALQGSVSELKGVVNTLGDRSREIGDIVQLISGIAAQTNLLALNAAIEAARAGSEGRGFAVVASEVRKLADQTTQAAGQIAGLIAQVREETASAVQSMEVSSGTVNESVEVITTLGATFEGIRTASEQTSTLISEVSASVQQAAVGAMSVVASIESIAAVAEQSAAGAQTVTAATEQQLASMEEVTAASNNLAHMAQELQEAVNRFKL